MSALSQLSIYQLISLIMNDACLMRNKGKILTAEQREAVVAAVNEPGDGILK